MKGWHKVQVWFFLFFKKKKDLQFQMEWKRKKKKRFTLLKNRAHIPDHATTHREYLSSLYFKIKSQHNHVWKKPAAKDKQHPQHSPMITTSHWQTGIAGLCGWFHILAYFECHCNRFFSSKGRMQFRPYLAWPRQTCAESDLQQKSKQNSNEKEKKKRVKYSTTKTCKGTTWERRASGNLMMFGNNTHYYVSS